MSRQQLNINIVKQLLNSERIPQELKTLIINLNNEREKVVEKYKGKGISNPNDIACYYENMTDEMKEEYENDILYYNFPIAILLCKKYSRYVPLNEWQDLYSHALFSIINILRKYKCEKGARFHTYLVSSLRGEIIKFMDTCYNIKINYHYEKKKFEKKLLEQEQHEEKNTIDKNSLDALFFEHVNQYRTIPFSEIKNLDSEAGELEYIEKISESPDKDHELYSQLKKNIAVNFIKLAKDFFENSVHNILERDVIQALFFEHRMPYHESMRVVKSKYPNLTYYQINVIENNFIKRFIAHLKAMHRDFYEKIIIFCLE